MKTEQGYPSNEAILEGLTRMEGMKQTIIKHNEIQQAKRQGVINWLVQVGTITAVYLVIGMIGTFAVWGISVALKLFFQTIGVI
jgi:hypothetical protein